MTHNEVIVTMLINIFQPKVTCSKMLTSVSGSEEAVEVGEPVIKVLNEAEPAENSLLINPTLALSGLSPKGHPSSYSQKPVTRVSSLRTNSTKAK